MHRVVVAGGAGVPHEIGPGEGVRPGRRDVTLRDLVKEHRHPFVLPSMRHNDPLQLMRHNGAMTESDTAVRSDLADTESDGPEAHDIPANGRSGFVRLGDRQVHYLEWGPATAPVVLALH